MDSATLEQTLNSAQKFQKFVASEIPRFDLVCVIITDQTGCECRVNLKRTLMHIGEKAAEVNIVKLNKVTCS
jgi:hypothetical protein